MGHLTPVVAIGTQQEVLAELQSILATYYEVKNYADVEEALVALQEEPAYAIVVDNNIKPTGGLAVLERVRRLEQTRQTPAALLIESYSEALIREAKCEIEFEYVVRPLEPGQVRKTVSDLVNAGIEKNWQSLPDVQREVLTETVGIFKNCFNAISDDAPIPVGEIEESCSPLVTAVENHEVTGLLGAVQAYDDYTYVHSLRVAIYLALLGEALGMKGDELLTLSSGGLMHDLGKQLVPQEVLNKPARLEEAEFQVMKSHVDHTKDIFGKANGITVGVEIIALQHHEKLDGTGYPLGLQGTELNTLARMGAIVDIYSALTDRRVYKPAMPAEKALSILESMDGGIDMALLGKFKEFLLDATSLPE